MNNYTVYMHVTPNNKKYIGITSMKTYERWRKGKGYKNQFFSKAINKYGWDNIEHIIVARNLTEDEAKWIEIEMILAHDTTNPKYGYNMTQGGDGNRGYTVSDETKMKISESKKGTPSPRKGIHLSDITKERLSKSRKGKCTGNDHGKAKGVICITTKRMFFTVSEGVKFYNVSSSNICKCCKGKRKSAGKYNGQPLKWRYVNYKHNKTYRVA